MSRRVPLHGRATTVTADTDSGHIFLKGIAHLIGSNGDLMHADLVPVIKRRCAPQGKQQHRGDPRLVSSTPAHYPRAIMITEHPVRPSPRRQSVFVVGDDALDRASRP